MKKKPRRIDEEDPRPIAERVREHCLARWTELTGLTWKVPSSLDSIDETPLEPDERRARDLHARIASEMHRARDWLGEASRGDGEVTRLLVKLCAEFRLAPLPSALVRSRRAEIVKVLEIYDVFHLGRLLSVEELAIVSLLLDNYPGSMTEAHTVEDVELDERLAVRDLLRTHRHPSTQDVVFDGKTHTSRVALAPRKK